MNFGAKARRGPGKLPVRRARGFAVRGGDGKVESIERELAVIDAAGGVRIEALQRGKTLTAGDVFGCLQRKGKPLPMDRLAAPVKLGRKDFR